MTDLVRTRNTPQQARLPGDQRAANVDGAFAVTTAAPLRGASYVLIDDVLTTGATASACAAALKDAGAGWVGVLTLAREDS